LLDRILERATLSIYDFSDDFAELGYDERTRGLFHQNATKYARAANIVLAVNAHVKNKYSYVNPNIHVIRNATNYENFSRETYESIDVLERIKHNGLPIIGYSGIANMGRIDGDVLDFLLNQRPNWQFVFVGPAHAHFVERYSTCRNVHILAPVAYQDLPCYMQYFDVAIVPFQDNENTKGNDLLKLHDYLAMGKPVVSTNIGGAVDLKEAIRIAEGPQEFLKSIEEFLVNHRSEDVVAQRKRLALKNSWRARTAELEALVKGSLATKERLV
jgi:glycosyltransferase involved in cell wall biosynthesis